MRSCVILLQKWKDINSGRKIARTNIKRYFEHYKIGNTRHLEIEVVDKKRQKRKSWCDYIQDHY